MEHLRTQKPPILYITYPTGCQGTWSLFQETGHTKQGSHWTGRQSTALHNHTTDNLEMPGILQQMSWAEGGNPQSTGRT